MIIDKLLIKIKAAQSQTRLFLEKVQTDLQEKNSTFDSFGTQKMPNMQIKSEYAEERNSIWEPNG